MNNAYTTAFDSEPPRGMPTATVALAVLAPFLSVGLMAAPLLFDAVRHAIGL